jgi:hypothetical protein
MKHKTSTLYYFPNSNKRFRDKGKVSRLKKGNSRSKMTVSTFCDPIILLRTLTYFLILSNSTLLNQLLSNRRSSTVMLSYTARIPRIVDSKPPRGTFLFFRVLCCVSTCKTSCNGSITCSRIQQTSTNKIPNPENG